MESRGHGNVYNSHSVKNALDVEAERLKQDELTEEHDHMWADLGPAGFACRRVWGQKGRTAATRLRVVLPREPTSTYLDVPVPVSYTHP